MHRLTLAACRRFTEAPPAGKYHGHSQERQAQRVRALRRALSEHGDGGEGPRLRAIQREMAAEWLNLADAVLHPLKRTE